MGEVVDAGVGVDELAKFAIGHHGGATTEQST
jgi:hypothetical protein